jgi:tetratricopeptide (TPR) repeat protein
MSKAVSYLVLLLLASAAFTLATALQPRASLWGSHAQSDNVLKILLGDGRRLFANHFFVKADVYFHSGYYPSIFDQAAAPKDSRHMTTEEHGDEAEEAHEKHMDFLGPPRDWIERFARHFMITKHTHLEGGSEREILPWLKLSAELDPQRVDTYTVAAFWLRVRLGKVKEADEFLRDGLRANPNSYEILFELGRLYSENYHDPARARNVWELALRRWREQESAKPQPNNLALDEITVQLARVEEEQGNFAQAIEYLKQAIKVSPAPEALQKEILENQQKLSAQSTSSAGAH